MKNIIRALYNAISAIVRPAVRFAGRLTSSAAWTFRCLRWAKKRFTGDLCLLRDAFSSKSDQLSVISDQEKPLTHFSLLPPKARLARGGTTHWLRLCLSLALMLPHLIPASLAFWFLCTGALMHWSTSSVYADVPRLINFQGRLTDASNNPRSGNFTFKFRIYDALANGTALWPSATTESQAVTVTNGVFSVQLGAVQTIPLSVFNAPNAYLEIVVNDGSDETLSPRQRLISSPYAFNSATLEGFGKDYYVSTGAVTQTIDGVKTFSSFPVKSGGLTPSAAGELATKSYVDSQVSVSSAGVSGSTSTWSATQIFKRALHVSNTNFFILGGSLGIGKSSPNYPLEVSNVTGSANFSIESSETNIGLDTELGAILFRGTDAAVRTSAIIRVTADGTWSDGVTSDAPSRMEFFTQSDNTGVDALTASRMVINSNGHVGIGNAAPTERLDVSGGNVRLLNGGGLIVSTVTFIGLSAEPTGAEGWIYYNTSSDKLRLRTGAAWVDITTGTISNAAVDLNSSQTLTNKLISGTGSTWGGNPIHVSSGGTGLTSAGSVANRILRTTDGTNFSMGTIDNNYLAAGTYDNIRGVGTLNDLTATGLVTISSITFNGQTVEGSLSNGSLIYNSNTSKLRFRTNNSWVDITTGTITGSVVDLESPQTITNKTLSNGSTVQGAVAIKDSDNSHTLLRPDLAAHDTIVTLNVSQTLTNKTWNGNTIGVGYGGTGAATLTGMLKGNDASAITGITGTQHKTARWTDANTIGTGALYDNGSGVGIGVNISSPSSKLDVVGGSVTIRGTNAGLNVKSGPLSISDSTGGNLNIQSEDANIISGTDLGTVLFRGADTNSNNVIGAMIRAEADAGWMDVGGDNDAPAQLQFFTQSDGSNNDLTSPRMIINSEGKVRIGTTDATSADKLGVSGDIIASGGVNITSVTIRGTTGVPSEPALTNGSLYYNSTTSKLRFRTNNAWVDISTASATGSSQFGIIEASSASFTTTGSNPGNVGLRVSSSAYFATSGQGLVYIGGALHVGPTNRFVVLASGKVGIGTADPVGLLQVGKGENTFVVSASGNVGIGTDNPEHKLSVGGTLHAKEMVVPASQWADYVFEEDYDRMPLNELEKYVKKHKRLPGIPSEQEILKKGVKIGETQVTLLQKIEELTLYLIDLKNENERLRNRISNLESER